MYANVLKYLHFRIQHEITVTAPNMNATSAHQVADLTISREECTTYRKTRKVKRKKRIDTV